MSNKTHDLGFKYISDQEILQSSYKQVSTEVKIDIFSYIENISVPDSLKIFNIKKYVNPLIFFKDHQPLISNKYNVAYQPLPKVACKTFKAYYLILHSEYKKQLQHNDLKNIFKEYEKNHISDEINFSIHQESKKLFGVANTNMICFDTLKQTDGREIKIKQDIRKDLYKFTFVRNPWKRLLASYLEKFCNPFYNYQNAAHITHFAKKYLQDNLNKSNVIDKEGNLTFECFVDILYDVKKSSLSTQFFDIHWLPQSSILNLWDGGIKDFNFIGKLENFEEDFNIIKNKTNLPFSPSSFNIDDYNWKEYKKKFPPYKEYYSNSDIVEKVREIYKDDIINFNYKF